MVIARNARSGFTIVEMLIVIGIMGVLLAILGPSYFAIQRRSKTKATAGSLRTLVLALEQYKEDMGDYPASLRDLVKAPAEGGEGQWLGPYVKSKDTPKDSFGNPFHYTLTQGAEHPYELSSYGSNGKGAPKSEWIDAWKL